VIFDSRVEYRTSCQPGDDELSTSFLLSYGSVTVQTLTPVIPDLGSHTAAQA